MVAAKLANMQEGRPQNNSANLQSIQASRRALGWTEIDALVIDKQEHLQTELIEIDENLCRAELTAAQRTAFSKRRKQIWEALHPESRIVLEVAQDAPLQEKKHGGVRANQLSQGFAAATAEATGQSKATTNRAIARADALGDEALAKVVNTSSAFGKVATSAAGATDTAPVVTAVFSSATPPDKASAYCPARFTVAGLTLYFVANLSAVEAGSF